MKINQKILSIPPFISTSWKNVTSLHLEDRNGQTILMIGLQNGSSIEIPNLPKEALQAIFAAHERFLEREESSAGASPTMPMGPTLPPFIQGGMPSNGSAVFSLPLNLGIDGNMGNLLQHNQEGADSPDLPKEVLNKIKSLSKAMGIETKDNLPKPEPHCNCLHCQIMRAFADEEQEELLEVHDEEISDADLRFREWDIHQSDDKLYIVSNPFNKQEHYNVFLGSPVGCTCGQANCEHIRAVLNS